MDGNGLGSRALRVARTGLDDEPTKPLSTRPLTHDIFISYSIKDQSAAHRICQHIEARGVRCWIAPRDILPGTGYAEAIIEAIEETRLLVLVLSDHANHSHHVQREVERAVAKKVPVVPIRIEDTELSKTLEYFISTSQWVDAVSEPLETAIDKLGQALDSLLAAKPPQPSRKTALAEPTWGSFCRNGSLNE